MARPPWVATVFYNNTFLNFGWSENLYPIGPDQATASAAVANLIPLRLALLSDDWTIAYARLDVPGSPRDSVVVPLPSSRLGTYVIAPPDKELPADSAVLVTLFGDPTKKNRNFWRVIGTQDMGAPNSFSPTNLWLSLFAAYATSLQPNFYVARNTPTVSYFVPIASVNLGRFTNRKMGRPFGLARGRRR